MPMQSNGLQNDKLVVTNACAQKEYHTPHNFIHTQSNQKPKNYQREYRIVLREMQRKNQLNALLKQAKIQEIRTRNSSKKRKYQNIPSRVYDTPSTKKSFLSASSICSHESPLSTPSPSIGDKSHENFHNTSDPISIHDSLLQYSATKSYNMDQSKRRIEKKVLNDQMSQTITSRQQTTFDGANVCCKHCSSRITHWFILAVTSTMYIMFEEAINVENCSENIHLEIKNCGKDNMSFILGYFGAIFASVILGLKIASVYTPLCLEFFIGTKFLMSYLFLAISMLRNNVISFHFLITNHYHSMSVLVSVIVSFLIVLECIMAWYMRLKEEPDDVEVGEF